jgi:AraC-like DNA-binding protein
MLVSDINPFVRYARQVRFDTNSDFFEVAARDTRLFYVTEGCGKIKVKGMEYELTAHSLLIIGAGIPYCIATPKAFANYIVINFDYTQGCAQLTTPINPIKPEGFRKDMLTDPCDFEDASVLCDVLYLKDMAHIQKALTKIVSEYTQKLLYHTQTCGHLLAQCIFEGLRFWQRRHISLEIEKTNRLISYIQEHFTEDISNESVGKEFGYHRNYVSYLLKQMTGMPLHRYVLHLRLMHAVNLIENTDLAVSEIADASGFYDVAYFSSYFKKHFGITPTKYKMG